MRSAETVSGSRASGITTIAMAWALLVTASIGAVTGVVVPAYRDACLKEEALEVIADFVFFRRTIARNLRQGEPSPSYDWPGRRSAAPATPLECKSGWATSRWRYECELFALDNGTQVVTFRVLSEDRGLLDTIAHLWGTPLSGLPAKGALTFLFLVAADVPTGRLAANSLHNQP